MSRAPDAPLPAESYEGLLADTAPRFGLSLGNSVIGGLSRYLAELDVWRQKMNLVGDLHPEELVSHTLESVLGDELIIHGARVVDIGSGGGFPGLPIAIARPDLHVSLVEPRQKRVAFLRHVARSLSLPNATVIGSRIEEVGGQTFDVGLARAVGGLEGLLEKSAAVPFGSLLVWTTDEAGLGRGLSPRFRLDRVLPIPGSRRRVVARFLSPTFHVETSGIIPPG